MESVRLKVLLRMAKRKLSQKKYNEVIDDVRECRRLCVGNLSHNLDEVLLLHFLRYSAFGFAFPNFVSVLAFVSLTWFLSHYSNTGDCS